MNERTRAALSFRPCDMYSVQVIENSVLNSLSVSYRSQRRNYDGTV